MCREYCLVQCRDNCDMSYGSHRELVPDSGRNMITVTVNRVIHPHHNDTRRWRAIVSNLRWKKTQ